MTIIHAIILGLVEGITEFLPISSTGHLILASDLLRIPITEFVKSFQVAIQVGALMAIVVLYGARTLKNPPLLKKIAIAFIPTALIGVLFYKIIKTYLLGNISVVIWSLLIGGIILIACELWEKKKTKQEPKNITPKNAFILGLFQTIAFIPGVSRSGATIIGGIALGISRKDIVEFSFLLGVPTLLAATGLDLIKTGFTFSLYEWSLLTIGFFTAFISALMAVRVFIRYIEKNNFIGFGIYRILLALAFLFLI